DGGRAAVEQVAGAGGDGRGQERAPVLVFGDEQAEDRGAEPLGQVEEQGEGGDGPAPLGLGGGGDHRGEQRRVQQRRADGEDTAGDVEPGGRVPGGEQDERRALEDEGEERAPPG